MSSGTFSSAPLGTGDSFARRVNEYGPPAVGTEKRERQKQARQEKIQALRQVEQRESVRRRGLMIGVLIAAFVAFAIVFSVLTADEDDADTATDDTTTTQPAEPLPCPEEDGASERTTEFPAAPPTCIDQGTDYGAVIETDAGTIEIDLLEEEAPETVNNFVYLSRYRFYEGVDFHRVIPGFVVQGGQPSAQTSGPGYQFGDELPEPADYAEGSVAMANGGPDTNGSQFFILVSDSAAEQLVAAAGGEAGYSLFGQVTEGMDVVAAIEADGSPGGAPTTVHTIESVTITES